MEVDKNKKEIIKAGFNRFYSEGYVKWPEENIRKIFDGVLENEEINFLKSLEEKGYIDFVGKGDCYVLILSKIDEI